MTSFFRKKISQKLLSALNSPSSKDASLISPLIRVNRNPCKEPQLFLPFNKLSQVLPGLGDHSKFESILKTMRNQGLPTAEGIINISISKQLPLGFLFTIDKHVFNRIVLLDICVNLDDMPKKSSLFQHLPKHHVLLESKLPPIGNTLTMNDFQSVVYLNSLAEISKYIGINTIHLNHIEDWGPICGTLLAGYQEFGSDDELEQNPLQHLYEVINIAERKSRRDINFQESVSNCIEKLKNGDQTILKLWLKIKEVWCKEMNKTYKKININFDATTFDSTFQTEIEKYSDILIQQGIINNQSDVEMNINIASANGISYETVTKSFPGRPLYSLARDIATTIGHKENFNFEHKYFIGNENVADHHEATFKLLQKFGFNWSSNLSFLGIRDATWWKKFKRENIFLFSVLNDAKTHICHELNQDITLKLEDIPDDVVDNLALSALVLSILKKKRNQELSFDFNEALNFDERSEIGIQFLHAGLLKIQDDSEIKFRFDIDLSPLGEPQAQYLIQQLSMFDEVILKSHFYMEPSFIVSYLHSICHFTKNAIDVLRLDIKSDRLRVIKARLLLFHSTQKIVYQCLKLLGLEPLEKVV